MMFFADRMYFQFALWIFHWTRLPRIKRTVDN